MDYLALPEEPAELIEGVVRNLATLLCAILLARFVHMQQSEGHLVQKTPEGDTSCI